MNQNALLAIFPFLFVGLWVGSTALLGAMSGWYRLQDRFPDRPEQQPIIRLRFQSASFGDSRFAVANYGNCLRYDVCPSGLRVGISRIFGPFSRPFFVPWSQIKIEKKSFLGLPHYILGAYRLGLGNPEETSLNIYDRAARRIEAASGGNFRLPSPGEA
ncbi:hypothetical protein [Novosphingobium sp.]|uniref:hypothetical protein n=1 Tax=Novosphingobium sp. TaxID=1874826 RepID=UPI00286BA40C|nr:hypothetical protein [Novosphingobium sp.]